ncbi:MAG: sulfatase-like hydrolase/transferase [Kiritimatiellales bacterium]|nr:sulfatase-like hydrolase/transferase [Kiritimatiellales bacterium]
MKMKTSIAFYLCSLALLSFKSEAAFGKPNVLVILADDMGYSDVGFNGCKDIPTPHIDSIAANGAKFSAGYVTAPQCAPSRAGLLSGRPQNRFGREENGIIDEKGIPQNIRMFGDYMHDAGYRTGAVGKWHQGAMPGCHPLDRGFDWFYGFLPGASFYHPKPNKKTIPGILENRTPQTVTRYLTNVFGDAAVRFIGEKPDKPFFLYLSFNAPHEPMEAPEEYLKRFEHLAKPDDEPITNRGKKIEHPRQIYAAMVSCLDDTIGRVLDALKAKGVEENTLIFFLSDNGGPIYKNGSCNKPLSGMKGHVLEGGIRVPYAVQWKGVIPAEQVLDTPVSSLDLLPTSLSAAGTVPPDELEGENLLPLLIDSKQLPQRALFCRFPFPPWQHRTWWEIRRGDWKLIYQAPRRQRGGFADGPGQLGLFNLAEDIGETKDLSNEYPEIRQQLQEEFDAINATLPPEHWVEKR